MAAPPETPAEVPKEVAASPETAKEVPKKVAAPPVAAAEVPKEAAAPPVAAAEMSKEDVDVKNQDPEKASTSVSLEVGTHLKIMVGCFFFF